MKLSNLRPCDNCGGKIAPLFYVVRTSIAVINPDAANETLGLTQMFRGSLSLAEAFSSKPDAVKIGGDENKELMSEIFLCQNCYFGDVNVAVLVEKIAIQKRIKDENDGI